MPALEEPYRRLLRILRAGRGLFTLVPVESNLTEEERDRLVERLRGDLAEKGLSLRTIELTYKDWDPVEVLERNLGPELPEPLVLLVCGLERTPPGPVSADGVSRPPAFARLNQARELLEERYPVPTIVWCEPYTYGTLRRHAPDFFDHFTGLVRFLNLPDLERQQDPGSRDWAPGTVELERSHTPSSGAAVRFYEERLENRALDDRERVRALLGLSEALVERRDIEGIAALERAAEYAEQAIARLAPEADLEAWSRANLLLARALGELGRPELALASAEQAVDGYRSLSLGKSEALSAPFADALIILSNVLSHLGRREEALEAIQQAVEIYRDLARSRADAFRPGLASSLHNLSIRLADLGRREDALEAIQQAVEIRRDLARARPDAFRPGLAMSLNNLSILLADLGRREEALEAIQRAVEIERDLARSRPDAFRPDLAMSLNNLSSRLANLGRREEGLEASQQAVEIDRDLARSRPEEFRPHLSSSLNNLSNRLAEMGGLEEALKAIKEAVGIRRDLARIRPDAFQADLVTSLGALHLRLRATDQDRAALDVIGEALDVLEPLFRRLPRGFARLMADVSRDYERTAEACGIQPDEERLRSIREILATVQD